MKEMNWRKIGTVGTVTAAITVSAAAAAAMGLAWMISQEWITLQAGQGAIGLLLTFLTFGVTWISAKRMRKNKLAVTAAAAFTETALLLMIKFMCFPADEFALTWRSVLPLAAAAAAGLLAKESRKNYR